MMRRMFLALAALGGLAVPAAAQDVVRASVGGELAGRVGEVIDIPVTVDMRQAPGRLLGAYRLRLSWDPAVLTFINLDDGGFAPHQAYVDSVYIAGKLRATAILPAGMGGVITLFTLQVQVQADTVVSPITLVVDELTQAGTFADLMPFLQTTSGMFCQSLGRWGDTNGDGRSDSRDALIALSNVVGLIPAIRIDTLSTTPLITDTTRASLADVDADGAVSSRDALIILSNAVGLPVTGFRIGVTAASACGTGSASTLVILPDTIDLEVNQRASVIVQARDSTGRAVATPTLLWRSTDVNIASVAGPDFSDLRGQPSRSGPIVVGQDPLAIAGPIEIEGRGPGTATLTAELGPGIRGTMVVNVVARRRVWLVDVRRGLNQVTQTGALRHPFGRIQDAVFEAQDGDTIRIAPGTYQETVFGSRGVALLGDSTNRPVIDPRGTSFWSTGSNAIGLGSGFGKMTLAHLLVRAGGAYLYGHDVQVRSVKFEQVRGFNSPLEIYTEAGATGGPTPGAYGNVLVDSVEINGFDTDAIYIDNGDTVTVRNTVVTGDSVRFSCSHNMLLLFDASLSQVHDNRFTNGCDGIEIQHGSRVGRAVLSRNVIDGLSRTGILVTAPVVRLDHNVVKNIVSQNTHSGQARGIWIRSNAGADSLFMLGDSIVNTAHRGLVVDSSGRATIDSLSVIGGGQDSSFNSDGVELGGGHFTLRATHVRNIINGNGIVTCEESSAFLRGSRITDVSFHGVMSQLCFDSTTPDTLVMSRDTILRAGQNGISAFSARFVRMDTILVDSTGSYGVLMQNVHRGSLTGSTIRRATDGVGVFNVDTVLVRNNLIDLSANTAFAISFTADTSRVRGNVITGGATGVRLENTFSLLDSNRVAGHTIEGLLIDGNAAAIVTRSRFTGNGLGVRQSAFALASRVSRSIIAGNVGGNGIRNDAGSLVPLNADTNFWGDAAGPACRAPATGCGNPATADSVLSTDVTFANHLTAPDPLVPAPPAIRPVVQPAAASSAPATAVTRPVQPGRTTRQDEPFSPRRSKRAMPQPVRQ